MCLKINSGNQWLDSPPAPPFSASRVVHHNVKINTVFLNEPTSGTGRMWGYQEVPPPPPNVLGPGVVRSSGSLKACCGPSSQVAESWLSKPTCPIAGRPPRYKQVWVTLGKKGGQPCGRALPLPFSKDDLDLEGEARKTPSLTTQLSNSMYIY